MTYETIVTVTLRCVKCKAKKRVSSDDPRTPEYGHYCTCGSLAPMLLNKVEVKKK